MNIDKSIVKRLAIQCGIDTTEIVYKDGKDGYADCSPTDPTHTDNRKMLEKELGDLRYWMIEMCKQGDVSKEAIHRNADLKAVRVKQWLHHQEE